MKHKYQMRFYPRIRPLAAAAFIVTIMPTAPVRAGTVHRPGTELTATSARIGAAWPVVLAIAPVARSRHCQ